MERDIKVQLTHHNDYINRSNIEKISPQQLFKKKINVKYYTAFNTLIINKKLHIATKDVILS